MRIIETAGYKRITKAQAPPMPGGQPPPPPLKKKKKRKPLDEPAQFDNTSIAPQKDTFINPNLR